MSHEVLLDVRQLTPDVARRMLASGVCLWEHPPSRAHGSGEIDAVDPDGHRSVIKIDVITSDKTYTGSREAELDFAFECELASIAAHPFNPWPINFGYRFSKAYMREEGHAHGRFVYRRCDIIRGSNWYTRHLPTVDLRPEHVEYTLDGKRKVYSGRARNVDEILFYRWYLHPDLALHPEDSRKREDWSLLERQISDDGPGLAFTQPWSIGWALVTTDAPRPSSAFTGAAEAVYNELVRWRWYA